MSDVKSTIAEIVERSCIELFSYYGVDIAPRAAPGSKVQIALCGVIGFSGHDLRGSLMLACTLEPLRLARSGEEIELRDWLAELTNQLLGRVKNRLITMGAEIHCSTPLVLSGERIAPLSSQPLDHLFTADGGVVSVWCDAEHRPDLVLAPANGTPNVALEGESLFF